ncbi:MAG: hypothetical protein WBC30_10960 [Candidatus Sulfotelmatobacter sp.]
MIDPSEFGHELNALVTTTRESRKKLNSEKDNLLAQIKGGHVHKQEGILTLIEMDLSHSNDIMLPVVQATLRAAQLQYNSALLLTKSVNLARRLEKLTVVLMVLTAVLAVGAAGDLIAAANATLRVIPPPIVKFAPRPPPLFGR